PSRAPCTFCSSTAPAGQKVRYLLVWLRSGPVSAQLLICTGQGGSSRSQYREDSRRALKSQESRSVILMASFGSRSGADPDTHEVSSLLMMSSSGEKYRLSWPFQVGQFRKTTAGTALLLSPMMKLANPAISSTTASSVIFRTCPKRSV